MKHTATYKLDEVAVGELGMLYANIEIDYSFNLDVETEGGEQSRSFIAINNFSVDEIRINKLKLVEWQFAELVGVVENGRISGVILEEIREMEVGQ